MLGIMKGKKHFSIRRFKVCLYTGFESNKNYLFFIVKHSMISVFFFIVASNPCEMNFTLDFRFKYFYMKSNGESIRLSPEFIRCLFRPDKIYHER